MVKKHKAIQLQSPENFIRSRARSLKILECLISPDWKVTGIANIVVARQHTNGNITAAIYLVDLYCLGVKDSIYMFNTGETLYREKIQSFEDFSEFEKVDYTLVHNIIYAAIEFAGDYGFIPCKTYDSITKYLLEEDTDAIELIDVECGLDGKPAYFSGPNDTSAFVNTIIKKLERTAGKGNYNVTLAVEGEDEDEFDIENSETDEEDDMTFAGAEEIFRKYEAVFTSLDVEKLKLFMLAVNIINDSIVDRNAYTEFYDRLFDDLDIDIEIDEIPAEMLNQNETDPSKLKVLQNSVIEIFNLPNRKIKKIGKLIHSLKTSFPGVPFILFLELYFDENRESAQYKLKQNEYILQYPDYPLFKIIALLEGFIAKQVPRNKADIAPISALFIDRKSLHVFEMQQYLSYVFLAVSFESNQSKLAAFHDVLVDLEIPDEIMDLIFPVLYTERIKICHEILNIPDK